MAFSSKRAWSAKGIFSSQARILLSSLKPVFPLLLLGLVLSLLLGPWLDRFSESSAYEGPPPMRGMALGLFSKNPQYDYAEDLKEIKHLGANAVLLMIPWYQRDIYANTLEPRYDRGKEKLTPSDALLETVIAQSHRLGLQVMLLPYLRFDHLGPQEWRGVLKPKDFEKWTGHYHRFLMHYADLAQKNQVAWLSVGSELGSLEDNRNFWIGLIQKVRRRYKGRLLYSANWDHFHHPTFWRDLDAIGITGYFRLTTEPRPTLSSLKEAWEPLKRDILNFKRKFPDLLFIFTEVGYPSVDGAGQDPWNYLSGKKANLKEQALCYQAFIETWNHTPELHGVFWWAWFGKGGAGDKGYTPRGKPAEDLLKKWYGSASAKKKVHPYLRALYNRQGQNHD